MTTKSFFTKVKFIVYVFITFNFQLLTFNLLAQSGGVGINSTGGAADNSAMLDVSSSNQGMRIPRVALTSTTSAAPITNPVNSLLVYDSVTVGDVTPGFYYWDAATSKWLRLSTGSGGGWSTTGNAGTDTATNFIGTTDDRSWVMKSNNTERMKISKAGNIGIGTTNPASSAILDISSTTKGLRMPNMTSNQRDAISSPATGLQIYNTDCGYVDYFNGTCWISMSKAINDPDAIISSPPTTVFCAAQTRTYSVPPVTGATYYNWTVPAGTIINSGQGTTSIDATFGNISGNVCVKARNACETSGQTCLAVSVDPIPNTPGNITGITTINPGQNSVTYFIASVNGASTYTWTVPAGATIASGTGTTTIVVNFSCTASSGNISVTANSICGSSPSSTLALTITPLLSVSAGSPVFGGVGIGGSPTASGGNPAYTYLWSPTTNLSSSTISNPTALCSGATTTYTVIVTDTRGCIATSNVTVTRNLTADAGSPQFGGHSIGGSFTASGGAGTYTYSWSPGTDLTSLTVANPVALCSGSTSTYTVTITDANVCTATSNVVVTRNLTANAGTAQYGGNPIGGSPTASIGQSPYSYSWSPTANLSSATVANPIVQCARSISTYTVTVTDANGCTAKSNSVSVTGIPSGGTITTLGAYKIHTFTSSGTFVPGCSENVEVLVVAGGGGGGSDMGGGGGGGGVIYQASYAVTGGASTAVTVGAGGAGAPSGINQVRGYNGGNSTFYGLTAIGGGGGASEYGNSGSPPGNGGSGGGSAGSSSGGPGLGTPGQGFDGGPNYGDYYPSGGGGAGGAGFGNPAHGGAGISNSILGISYYWGGGGGGSGYTSCGGNGGNGGGGGGAVCTTSGGAGLNNGSPGGGGSTVQQTNRPGGNAGANTGGGGGGGSHYNSNNYGGNGGSGIVIVKYLN